METKNILRIVVASPSDVRDERRLLDGIMEELNRGIAATLEVRLELSRWETDSFPGFHPEGPQGLIDPILNIADCDIFLGIFWRRFGTPAKGAASGTDHEFQTAYQSWKTRGRPQIMFYFREDRQLPQTPDEQEQRARLDHFKKNFPKEGFFWNYKNKKDFKELVHDNLSNYLRQHAQILREPVVQNKNDRAVLQSYSRHIQQRFSIINLLGERRHEAGDALSRMADISRGFIPLNLIDWQDDGDSRSTTALNIDEIFFDNPPVGELVEPPQRHFLLRGLPGSGKTTLLRYLAHRFAVLGLKGDEEYIPVCVRLKDLKLGKTSLEVFVREEINRDSGSPENTETLCARGRFLENPMVLLFDGLDEIEDAETNQNITEALNDMARQRPRCKIIVSSRPVGLKKEDYPKYRPLDLLPLGPEMIDAYLDKWFSGEVAKTAAIRETLKNKPRIRALAANPFLLSMICFTYEQGGDAGLIERRSELYKNCTNRLLKRRYALDTTAVADDEKILAVLKDLSLRFFLWQEADFPVDHVNIIGRRVLTVEELGKTEDFLDRVQRDTGLLQRDRQGFTFVHRSLWEYFTALALLEDKKLDFVIRHAANPDWEEVVRLYAGLLEKDKRVEDLINGLWTINRPLALRVTTEVKTSPAELLQPLIAREAGNQGKLLLIDSLEQSLPLIAETDRQSLVQETLRILLIDCKERDCEVIYHAQELLEKMGLRPLEPDGLIYELFDLAYAADRQQKFLKDPANHFEWIDVKGGMFWMGDDDHLDDDKPAHRVKVDSFCMAKHPVTNRLLSTFEFAQQYEEAENLPATGNTWWEAYYFALWIDARLPTEAEWEFAARGCTHAQRTQYYFGDDVNELLNHAWFGEDNRQFAHGVDELNPRTGKENLNPLGLANMLGNVWEWCEDWYARYSKPKNKDDVIENPRGPKTGQHRIRRGGGFTNSSDALRCARRYYDRPTYRDYAYGFRLVGGASH